MKIVSADLLCGNRTRKRTNVKRRPDEVSYKMSISYLSIDESKFVLKYRYLKHGQSKLSWSSQRKLNSDFMRLRIMKLSTR